MTWFKVDDAFYDHPKVAQLDLEAVGLWTLAGAWASRQLTDGSVPARMVPRLGGSNDLALQLVEAGLWDERGDEFVFRDWGDYQPSRDRVLTERTSKRAAAAAANHKRWHVARGLSDPDCELCRSGVADESQERSQERSVDRSLDASQIDQCRGNPPEPEPSSSKEEEPPIRDDVEALLDLLEELIVANGSKRPSRNKTNREAARLLLDRDKHTFDQVAAAIRWSQQHEFWRTNILSMSKLRAKYDQMRLQAQREQEKQKRAAPVDIEKPKKWFKAHDD